MQTSVEATYLDSSAIVKLVNVEPESETLRQFLAGRSRQMSCSLARVEVVRAARRRGAKFVARAREVLESLELIRLDDELLDRAAELQPITLRSLDAIHLAAAQTLGAALSEVITYDQRMATAARGLGLQVVAPSHR